MVPERLAAWSATLFLFAGAALAQANEQLAFEAVSVKPRSNSSLSVPPQVRNGQFSSSIRLDLPIAMAYGFRMQGPKFVVDGPGWLYANDTVYDIEGTVPASALPVTLPTPERQRRIQRMMQALLEDRFQLKVHGEQRTMPVYAITVAEDGVKLPKADIQEKDCPPSETDAMVACHTLSGGIGRGIRGRAATIGEVASYVQAWTRLPVLDRSGVRDLFRFETTPWLDSAATGFLEGRVPVSELPTLTEWFARMGLKMDVAAAKVEVLVVDHVAKPQ